MNNRKELPRLMIAAPSSGSGKTLISCGLLRAFSARGLQAVSYKCGPDYIDPMFHREVLHIPSGNLDLFFTEPETTRGLLASGAENADLALIEGVMGYFDGAGGTSEASSYAMACETETPVVLVVNARGMSLSVIALINGFLNYEERSGRGKWIKGVILNRTTKKTFERMAPLIEEQTGIKALGYLPQDASLTLDSRHLGLVMPEEVNHFDDLLDTLAKTLEKTLDMDALLSLASDAPGIRTGEECLQHMNKLVQDSIQGTFLNSPRPRIAVARDEAFCFYYRENLDLLKRQGADLVFFSPLSDRDLPEGTDGLLLGGGYPELHGKVLAENHSLRGRIREKILSGMPYLAECGGFMYLHEYLEDAEGKKWPMCGVYPGRVFHAGKLTRFGYASFRAEKGQLLDEGREIRGHEFHYYESEDPGSDFTAYRRPDLTWPCIHGSRLSAAGFPHLYYWSNPDFSGHFLMQALQYQKKKKL